MDDTSIELPDLTISSAEQLFLIKDEDLLFSSSTIDVSAESKITNPIPISKMKKISSDKFINKWKSKEICKYCNRKYATTTNAKTHAKNAHREEFMLDFPHEKLFTY